MAKHYQKGDKVEWNWAGDKAQGTVEEVFTRRVQRTLKGTKIVRNGSEEAPAYLIKQADGDQVLKLHSELNKAS